MRTSDLASILLKTLGIYCLLQAIPTSQGILNIIYFQKFEPLFDDAMIFSGIVALLLYLTFGAILFFFSNKIASKITVENPPVKSTAKLNPEIFHAIAISIVGLFIISTTIPKAFELSLNVLYPDTHGLEKHLVQTEISPQEISNGIRIIIELIIGIFLFLGSGSISRFWNHFLNRIKLEQG